MIRMNSRAADRYLINAGAILFSILFITIIYCAKHIR